MVESYYIVLRKSFDFKSLLEIILPIMQGFQRQRVVLWNLVLIEKFWEGFSQKISIILMKMTLKTNVCRKLGVSIRENAVLLGGLSVIGTVIT